MSAEEGLEVVRSLLSQFKGPKAALVLNPTSKDFLDLDYDGDTWAASGRHYALEKAPFVVSDQVRAVLDLPWPAGSIGPIQFVRGTSEKYHFVAPKDSGESNHAIHVFALDRDSALSYGVDLLESTDDASALSVWSVEPGGQGLTFEGTLDEVLSEWLDGTAFEDDAADEP